MPLSKPMLGLITGGTIGLLDGLSGFLEPSLAAVMTSVITFAMLKGLLSGLAIGFFSQRVQSMPLGLFCGHRHRRNFELPGNPESGDGPLLGHYATRHAAGTNCGIRDAEVWNASGSLCIAINL